MFIWHVLLPFWSGHPCERHLDLNWLTTWLKKKGLIKKKKKNTKNICSLCLAFCCFNMKMVLCTQPVHSRSLVCKLTSLVSAPVKTCEINNWKTDLEPDLLAFSNGSRCSQDPTSCGWPLQQINACLQITTPGCKSTPGGSRNHPLLFTIDRCKCGVTRVFAAGTKAGWRKL